MKKTIFIVMTLVVLLLAACSNSSTASNGSDKADKADKAEATKETKEKELVDASGEKINLDSNPKSFATLSSGEMDILLKLGANVTGRPTSEHAPKAAKDAEEIGNPHQPNFEKLAKVNPDVLVTTTSFKQHAKNVENQGTDILYTKSDSVEDIQTTITNLGAVLDKTDKAKEINQTIDKKVKDIESHKQADSVKTLLVYGAPGTFLAALPNSLSGDILEKAGGENIAKDFEKADKFPQYANLSPEKIIAQNPEAVMLITHGDPKAVKDSFEKEMKQNAAWKNLDAVKNDQVTVLPADLFGANPGTKVTDALDTMQKELAKVK